MERVANFMGALIILIILSPIIIIIAILIRIDSPGPSIFRQQRIGLKKKNFMIYKFRTMVVGTPDMPSEMVASSDRRFTRLGKLIRRMSIDELPQLINIIKGDMNFVGPRPALYNQYELIEMRDKKGVHNIRPGITGWAQVNGREAIPLKLKVQLDEYYLLNRTFWLDLKIIWKTFFKSVAGADLYRTESKQGLIQSRKGKGLGA